MIFYDCRTSYGKYINKRGPHSPYGTLDELLADMQKAEISGGLIYNVAADNSGVNLGNELLAADLATAADNRPDMDLHGMYTLVPSATGELPAPAELPAVMKATRMGALRINPAAHRYLPSPRVLGDYLEMATERRIPVLLDTSAGLTIEAAECIMAAFPDLTAILFYDNVWPCDRILRPFLAAYGNLRLDTTHLTALLVYEETVSQFGADRLVYGSGAPTGYMGVNMLTIMHSDISEAEKLAICSGNLRSIIEEADFS